MGIKEIEALMCVYGQPMFFVTANFADLHNPYRLKYCKEWSHLDLTAFFDAIYSLAALSANNYVMMEIVPLGIYEV